MSKSPAPVPDTEHLTTFCLVKTANPVLARGSRQERLNHARYDLDGNAEAFINTSTGAADYMELYAEGPGSMDLSDPQSFNRYSYVENNPLNSVDPDGLDGCSPMSGGYDCSVSTGAGTSGGGGIGFGGPFGAGPGFGMGPGPGLWNLGLPGGLARPPITGTIGVNPFTHSSPNVQGGGFWSGLTHENSGFWRNYSNVLYNFGVDNANLWNWGSGSPLQDRAAQGRLLARGWHLVPRRPGYRRSRSGVKDNIPVRIEASPVLDHFSF